MVKEAGPTVHYEMPCMLADAGHRHTVYVQLLIIHARKSGGCQSWTHHASQ